MDQDLILALELLHKAKKLLRPHFRKHYWPVFYEDIDYIIQAIIDVQRARTKGLYVIA